MIPKIDPSLFTWQEWRAGHLLDLGVLCNREKFILENRCVLVKHAIGYCDAENLVCRPKINHKAVMYFNSGICFWSHLTNYEFNNLERETMKTTPQKYYKYMSPGQKIDCCEFCDISQGYFSEICRGVKTNPHRDIIKKIAKFTGLSVESLLNIKKR